MTASKTGSLRGQISQTVTWDEARLLYTRQRVLWPQDPTGHRFQKQQLPWTKTVTGTIDIRKRSSPANHRLRRQDGLHVVMCVLPGCPVDHRPSCSIAIQDGMAKASDGAWIMRWLLLRPVSCHHESRFRPAFAASASARPLPVC